MALEMPVLHASLFHHGLVKDNPLRCSSRRACAISSFDFNTSTHILDPRRFDRHSGDSSLIDSWRVRALTVFLEHGLYIFLSSHIAKVFPCGSEDIIETA